MAMNAHAGCPCRRFRAGKQRRIRLKPDRFHPRVILGQYVLRHVVIRRLARNDQIERTCRRVQPSGHARNDKRVCAAMAALTLHTPLYSAATGCAPSRPSWIVSPARFDTP